MATRTVSNFSLRAVRKQEVAGARGAKPDPLYSDIIEAFLESGEEATAVEGTDKLPLTLRQGLNEALRRMELKDKLLVSLRGADKKNPKAGTVYLSLRDKKTK